MKKSRQHVLSRVFRCSFLLALSSLAASPCSISFLSRLSFSHSCRFFSSSLSCRCSGLSRFCCLAAELILVWVVASRVISFLRLSLSLPPCSLLCCALLSLPLSLSFPPLSPLSPLSAVSSRFPLTPGFGLPLFFLFCTLLCLMLVYLCVRVFVFVCLAERGFRSSSHCLWRPRMSSSELAVWPLLLSCYFCRTVCLTVCSLCRGVGF